MITSHIVAVGENNEIGKDNDLLWRLPNDMKFFMETTRGHCVLMGRNTYESLGKPLKNRTNIVITRQNDYEAEGCVIKHSIEEGIEYARQQGENELFIIGGGKIYEQSLAHTDRIYLTRVYGEFKEAEVFYPKLNEENWEKMHEDARQKDERHAYDYTFYTFARK